MQRDRLLALYDEYKAAFSGKQIVLGDGPSAHGFAGRQNRRGREEVRLGKPFDGVLAAKNLTSFWKLQCIRVNRFLLQNV